MRSEEPRPIYSQGDEEPTYLDIQAVAGVTKHVGGYAATDELHRLCHLSEAKEIMEVGCGIGVGPAYIAKRFDCRVVAVDISEKMLAWARQRAQREGVLDRITFPQAGVRDLPLEDDRFDAVIVESVLAFVADKEAAVRELIRVIRPGGYLGLNESYWTQEPTGDLIQHSAYLGSAMITEAEWRAIWEAAPLEARVIQPRQLDAGQEVWARVRWVGWRAILAAWGRVLKMAVTDPRSREALRAYGGSAQYLDYVGYGLFVGRKPMQGAGN